MSLGQRIKDRRFALKLTQQDLATALNVTPQHISAIEKDKRVPALPSLAKLAEELGVTVDYLATGKEGIITDIIPAIKADKKISVEVKQALVTLMQALYANQEKIG